ncbi:hypothetical protein [Paracoccus alkenifer]|uniref:DUF4177 domain-containing protein n=1 Tax=Paracoccus alkenifer TaxID=65735 RepID=A0A1H6L357_9RHOB|nr:hypothetical protein [Paracoccus alkenifer]SEH80347.1 hypothetical protein SAMN04488075_1157 [Paracoccus alkenifer]
MQHEEYTVIPAPSRGEKAPGARSGAERFAHALTVEINRMAAAGWEYIRAETLPCDERSGLTSRTTVYHNVLVFRRRLPPPPAAQEPQPVSRTPQAAPATPSAGAPAAASAVPQAPAARHADLDDPGAAPADPAPGVHDAGPAPAFVQRPPLAARTDAQAGSEPPNGNRLGPASR